MLLDASRIVRDRPRILGAAGITGGTGWSPGEHLQSRMAGWRAGARRTGGLHGGYVRGRAGASDGGQEDRTKAGESERARECEGRRENWWDGKPNCKEVEKLSRGEQRRGRTPLLLNPPRPAS